MAQVARPERRRGSPREEGGTMSELPPLDNDAAIEFLKLFHPAGPWMLTAIHPERPGAETCTFRDEQRLRGWVEAKNNHFNLYFAVNLPMRDMSKKAERTDIKEVTWLHVDIDPRVGEELERERERILALFGPHLPEGVPPPTAIVSSGSGFQAFWSIDTPIEIGGDLAKAEQAKLFNLRLEQLFGGDACHNIDRIMRLPGSINLPNAAKRKKGRLPAAAMVVEFHPERVYPLNRFSAAGPSAVAASQAAPAVTISDNVQRLSDINELDKYGVPDRIKVICVQGSHPDQPKDTDNSRSAWVFDVVCQLVRCGVPDNVVYAILTDRAFAISESVLENGSGAHRYAIRQIERAKLCVADPVIFEMNQHHAAVSLAGKFRVMTLKPDPMYPTQMVAEFSTKTDFCSLYDHPRIAVSDKKHVGKGKYFLDSPQHEHFDGIDFNPGAPRIIEITDKSGRLTRYANMYAGFSVEPIPGNCELYLGHVRDNICDADATLYEYVLNLMASGVQQPADPQRVALSMRGVPGTGKGVFATEYGKIFGRHFFHITNPAHLTGKFNAHSAEAMFEFADETLNLNDRGIAALMKTHISERTKMIERKGVDAFQARNFARVWFSTNEDHPLMIEDNDRRYCALYVSPKRAKDKQYFKAILDQMNNGGRAALLHMLLERDIAEFNAEDIPQTKELETQKLLSATAGDVVIIGFAQEGHLPGALVNFGGNSRKHDRPWIAKSRGAGCLFEEMQRRGGRDLQHATDVALSRILKSWRFKSKPLGDCMGWEAPPLDKLRAAIAAKYPGVLWDHPELSDWGGVSADEAERQRKHARDQQQKLDQGHLGLSKERDRCL
jgi:hypothetical protein